MSSLRPFCLTSWLAVPATAVLLLLTPAAHAQTPAAQPATPAPSQSPDPAPAAPSQTTVAARSPEQRGVTSRAIDKVKEVAKSAADIFSRVPCLPPKGGSKAMGSLPHVASKLAAGQPVVIVAFGSSSTQGFGASSPEFNYPNRLAAQLRRHYPTADISVINAGVGGEDAPEMMKRLQTQVIDRHPDLVIWQVGTNAVLRNLDPADTAKLVEDGISRIQAAGGTDIVLVDPQYSPAVNQRKESAGKMIKLLGNVAELRKVGIFPRFEVMRDWHENQSIPVEGFVIADGLHMNDWGYACFAQLLGDDIIRSVGQIKLGVSVPADVRTYRPM
ncbi:MULTISPECIES: SGNH/GDSL hydrolase family protein [Bradyrhizobium]|uniref:SGNH/GDSL hydrolase family protein n=1 Tax=Bradyrhizobium TaxID=374 RepID=UPI001CD6E05C|nr:MULTISPECIES: SGNH/GDSL hydrolase family protein [Bradyrhizobium]MCA1392544.1 SGNH/GDSL hydrolase family protein [Bradyrhizobium sp. IC3123]MCA1506562.1 SGNH/GDSL hydrolase family protein [Bradyrhizobium sp. NBAIM02]MCA1511333.1 SGNH/GDSL hydrolase family protein [Bradyrhizobium sp. NBAIM01]MCA1526715.1 SGNH/GDSL hydrolase family protein [Bradyrhizobium yuanmingense]MCA1548780.1 SGNH/GDSL hydrolase family protein [Bradyrhizobium sp. BRP19]